MPVPSKNKIIFVCNSSWSVVRFRLDTIEFLLHAGYEIYVLSPRDEYTPRLEKMDGLKFIETVSLNPSGLSAWADLKYYRELKQLYSSLKPSLIFHYTIKPNIYGTMAAAALGIPSISVVTGLGYAFIERPILRRIASFLYKRSLPKAKETWFLNQDDQQYFIQNNILPSEKTFILPGEGIDTQKFQALGQKRPGSSLNFLLIGRLIREKGIQEFGEAAEMLRKKGFTGDCNILGFYDPKSPSSFDPVQMRRWQKQGILQYLGSTDDVRPHINGADCIVLPSYREGLPLSLLEAASMKKPIISTNTSGCREIVEDGVNGFLCESKNALSLAKVMQKMIDLSPEERTQMGIEGRKMVESRFKADIIKNIYLQKISAIIH
jgi:glycosyltransferase involved in cell wall biosynthesis